MQTELLSPAGDKEAAYSAFYFGADAVYLGLKQFSARAEAINFSQEDLDEITAYAHHLGKKVYVAINTLMQENELPSLLNALQMCADCRVDALIVQDLGIARLVKKHFPQLVLHGSTQIAVHNLAGALALKKMGFDRVVLARELSLKEIQHIQKNADIEIEVFIHGALCYSYSGLCAFSSLTTARSANRGKCVYSCRAKFKLNQKEYHPFSMKDLALEKEVLKLKGLSLKIEGRKKNALYVGAVTDYYRRILDTGKTDISLTDNLKQIFARPWTKLHFLAKNKNVIEPEHVGHRGLLIGYVDKIINQQITFKPTHPIARYDGLQIDLKGIEKPFGFSAEELLVQKKRVFEVSSGQSVTVSLPPHSPFIPKGAPVYLASSTQVKGAYPYEKPKPGTFRNKTDISVTVFISSTQIIACANNKSVEISGIFEKAQNPEKTQIAIQNAFEKTGDTPFNLADLVIQNPHDLFVPTSILNELRRALYTQINIEKKLPVLQKQTINSQTKETKWSIKTDQPHSLKNVDLTTIDNVIIEITSQTTLDDLIHLPSEKIILALPTIIRNSDIFQKTINLFYAAGFTRWQIGNIGGLTLIPKKAELFFDNTMNILNSQALTYALELGAKNIAFSVEDTAENILNISKTNTQTTLVVYQDIPLFISANCVRENSCAECTHQPLSLPLSNGKENFKLFSKNCQTTVIKEAPFYIVPQAKQINADYFRLDFCIRPYNAEEITQIIFTAQQEKTIKRCFTGNFTKKFS